LIIFSLYKPPLSVTLCAKNVFYLFLACAFLKGITMNTSMLMLLPALLLTGAAEVSRAAALPTNIDRSALCTTADGNTRLNVYYLDLMPQKIALMVESKFGDSTLSYLVNDLRGVYSEKTKTTTFSFEVKSRSEVQLVVGEKSRPLTQLRVTKTGETIPLNCQLD
jgi:hypothetical protein